MHRATIVLSFIAVLWGCDSAEDYRELSPLPDANAPEFQVTIERLDEEMLNQPHAAALAQWLDSHPAVRDHMLIRSNYLNPVTGQVDSALFIQQVWEAFSDSASNALVYTPMQGIFSDLTDVEASLAMAFRRIKAMDPQFEVPAVKTVVTGFSRDIYVSDTLWVISLENFMGPQATVRPTGPGGQPLPEYLMRRYQREYIVPMLLKSYGLKYLPQTTQRPTMLDEMLTYGKVYEFAKTALPTLPDSLIIRYSGQELAGVAENEWLIWGHLIEKQLLYSTNFLDYRPYIEEAPHVPAIGQACPGRIGTYIGWLILQDYRSQHPDIDILSLMAENRSQHILEESGYKP